MKFRPLFEPRDLWVGVYLDTAKRRIYILPVPCLGVVVEWEPKRPPTTDQRSDYQRRADRAQEIAGLDLPKVNDAMVEIPPPQPRWIDDRHEDWFENQ